jgi:signal transduction histidine kinase
LIACLLSGLLISYQLVVTILQPAWKDPATDWLRATLSWPELLVVGFVSLRLTRAGHAAARSWWMLSAALLSYAVAQTLWAVFAQLIYLHGVPFPSLADLFYLLQYPFFFAAIVLSPSTPTWRSRTTVVVDTLLWMGAVTALSWFFLLAPIYLHGGESPQGKFVSLAYPVGDLAVLFGLSLGLMRSTRGRTDRLALDVLVLALVCLILADSWFAALLLHSTTVPAVAYAPNLIWIATYLLIVLAGLVQLRGVGHEPSPKRPIPAPDMQGAKGSVADIGGRHLPHGDLIGSVRVLIPFLAALLASTTLLTHAALTYTNVPSFVGPLVVSLGLLLLAVVRQELTLLENARVHREREAEQARALALREANRRMEEFLQVASHELKTPLTSLQGNTELLVRRLHTARPATVDTADLMPLVGTVQVVLERSLHSLGRMCRLVDDLLDVVRIHEGRLDICLEACDLASVVQEAVDEQRVVVDARPISLDLPEKRPVLVLGDADRLGQVVTNYLTNALKYSAADRPVTVCLQVTDARARLTVHDQGVGLPAEEQVHVWERFYRARDVHVQSGSEVGLGLGLYICQSIIARHHGQLGVDSVPGEGAAFWFALALAPTA